MGQPRAGESWEEILGRREAVRDMVDELLAEYAEYAEYAGEVAGASWRTAGYSGTDPVRRPRGHRRGGGGPGMWGTPRAPAAGGGGGAGGAGGHPPSCDGGYHARGTRCLNQGAFPSRM